MFPGAVDEPVAGASYAIIGAPLERSTSFLPGTRFGPDRIRQYAEGFEDFDHRTNQHVTALGLVDEGNLRGWQDPASYLEFLAGEIQDMVAAERLPIVLGGEHTVSIAGVTACMPDRVVCIDAHLDLRESFDGDPYSHATVMHHLRDHVDEVIIIGARAGSEAEWDRVATDDGITAIEPDEVREHLDWLAETVASGETYLSLDIDGIDPAFAPGTGTREPFGLSPEIVRSIIELVAPTSVGMDIVEVNDRDHGETATLAASLLRRFVLTHANHAA